MKSFLKFAFVVLLVAGAFVAGRVYGPAKSGGGAAERKVLYWVDPMHPSYKSDKPGIAPDCGMKLEPVYEGGAPAPAAAQPEKKAKYYRDPENDEYRSDKPGFSPATGNELVPVYDEAPAFAPGTIQVSAERQQLIGVRYGTAQYTTSAESLRANGKVAMDERRVEHVHTRVEGFVEKVFADYTGQNVKKGDALFTVYSPEILAAQQELLLARKAQTVLAHHQTAGEHASSMFDASRRRLQLWDLSDAQIDEVLATGKPIRAVTVYAPASGVVLERKAYPNVKVSPEMDIYTLADLSKVWVMTDVFEQDIASIRPGMAATVRLPYAEGRAYSARVTHILPQMDAQTRTLKVRLELDNPGQQLKPEMFVDVEFRGGRGRVLTVPSEAVLDSGMRKRVFVDRGEGHMEPRDVETGERIGDLIVIRSGLKEGERIVVSGNFLLDSESQLRGAAGHD